MIELGLRLSPADRARYDRLLPLKSAARGQPVPEPVMDAAGLEPVDCLRTQRRLAGLPADGGRRRGGSWKFIRGPQPGDANYGETR